MNKTLMIIGVAALLATITQSQAQTVQTNVPNLLPPLPLTNAPAVQTIPNFLTQVETWALTVNTNYNWTNATVQIETGYKQVTGEGAASYIGVTYDFEQRFNAGVEGQFLGVGSAFNAIEVEGGYALYENHDFKLEFDVLGGWDNTRTYTQSTKTKNGTVNSLGTGAWEVEPELRALKMMTVNTYIMAAYSMPVFSVGRFNAAGEFRAGAGFFF
jgi:hypothetical protein